MDPVTGTTSTSSALGLGSASPSSTLGEHDFLKLLLTQLENQDPLDPLRGEELAAQLAQFSSVQELKSINQNLDAGLEGDSVLNQSITNSLATGLLGKFVRAQGDQVQLEAEGNAAFYVQPTRDVERMEVRVYDDLGNRVRTFEVGRAGTELARVEWDGKGDDGSRLSTGLYHVAVGGYDENEGYVSVQVTQGGIVGGIRYDSSGAYLTIGGRRFDVSNVVEVSAGEPEAPNVDATGSPLVAAVSGIAGGIAGLVGKIIP